MAQKFVKSDNYQYAVEAVKSFMQLPNGTFAEDGFKVNRRTDNFAVLGKVTERYGIVQNSQLIDAAESAFNIAGLRDFQRNIVVAGSGERLYATYDFQNQTRKLAKVGDEVGMRLTIQNSFDGSLRASLLAGVLRLVCKNGMMTTSREVSMTAKHGSQVSVGFVGDAIKKAMALWTKSLNTFTILSEVSVSQVQGMNVLMNLAKSNILSKKLLEGIQNVWDHPRYREDENRNLYNLYNATTQFLTHEVESERPELANRVSGNVLSALVGMSKGGEKFEKLVAPVTLEIVPIEITPV